MKTSIKEHLKVALLTYLVFFTLTLLFYAIKGWEYELISLSLFGFAFLILSFASIVYIFPYILFIFLYSYFFKINIFSRSIYVIGPLLYGIVFAFSILIPAVEKYLYNLHFATMVLIFSIAVTSLVIATEKLWLVLCRKYGWNKSIISPEKIDYKKHLLIILITLFIMFIIPEEVSQTYSIYGMMNK